MRAGRLRHRVAFQHLIKGGRDEATGEALEERWDAVSLSAGITLDNVPAEVLTGAGRERHLAGADWAEIDARINTRWFPADEIEMYKWRIVWITAAGVMRTYNVDSVETDVTGKREWRFKCKDGINDGL